MLMRIIKSLFQREGARRVEILGEQDLSPEYALHSERDIIDTCETVRLLTMEGETQRAEVEFDRIAGLRDRSPMVALCELNMLWFSGRRQAALEAGREACGRFPDDPVLLGQWAHFAQAMGRHLDLVEASATWPARTATHAPIQRTLGDSFLALGAESEAARCYEIAVSQDPNDALALHNLGFVCASLGLLEKAEPSLLRALELDPEMAEAYNNLSIVHQKRKNFSAAIDCIRQAVALDGENVRYLSQLASLLMYTCDWTALEPVRSRLIRLVEGEVDSHGRTGMPPLLAISLGCSPALQNKVAMAYFRSKASA